MAKIVIHVDQNGGVKIDAQDFVGVSCQDATKVFEQAYASDKRKEELKPEYWQTESVKEGDKVRGW